MAQRHCTDLKSFGRDIFSAAHPAEWRRSRCLGSRRPRRGVLLLVSLVLLVMFLMLGVTFVLTAGNFRRSSEAYQRMLERPNSDAPERSGDLLDSVARDLVRGTSNLNSPFSDENLLEDLYGQSLLRGKLRNNPDFSSGFGASAYFSPHDRNGKLVRQFLELAITPDHDFVADLNQTGVDDYAGLVLTFLSGELKGTSVRVVSSINSTNSAGTRVPVLTVVAPTGSVPSSPSATTRPARLPVAGDTVLINGRPFSGDGSGSRFAASSTNDTPRRLNESYDAVDRNNPWLAYKNENGGGTAITWPSWGDAAYDWVPGSGGSLSRPFGTTPQIDCDNDGEADSIWIDAGLPLQMRPDGSYVKPLVAMLVRDLDGRVNLNAHGSPSQSLSIPSTQQALGQGYGPAEIDPGHALIWALDAGETMLLNTPEDATDQDGNPLYGLYDKRRQEGGVGMPSGDDTNLYVDGDAPDTEEGSQHFYDYGNTNSIVTPLDAEGKGLHGINPLTGGIDFQPTDGYVFSYQHRDTNYGLHVDTAGGGTAVTPYGPQDLEAVLRFSDADSDSLESKLLSDLHDIVVKMDANGNPISGQTDFDHSQMQHLRELLTTDSWDLPTPSLNWPKELAPTAPGSTFDRPRQITDLIARKFQDQNLGMTDAQARLRAESLVVKLDLTTGDPLDASGSPSINLAVAPSPGATASPSGLKTARNNLVYRQLIAPGLLRGTRMNVNRLFGDGQDNADASGNQNQVSDEPGEVNHGETALGADFDHNGNGIAGATTSGGGGTARDPGDQFARQHYAQQLYLLLMLLADGLENDVPIISSATPQQVLARRLAQYAVNAADYRDADSIMTPFEYDADPFDATGWDSDSNFATDESNDGLDNDGNGTPDDEARGSDADRGVVWGSEAPALVMTETLALHDRRTRDEPKDASYVPGASAQDHDTTTPVTPAATNPDGTPEMEDDHFDQYALPQGSLFIELQRIAHHGFVPRGNPATGEIQRDPATGKILYDFKGPQDIYDAGGLLNLSKTVTRPSVAASRPGEQDPVWRIAISYPHVGGSGSIAAPPTQNVSYKSPDRWPLHQSSGSNNPSWDPSKTMQPYPFTMDPFATSPSAEDVQCERFVWFHQPAGTSSPPGDVYFNQSNTELKLEPGEYALIGPRDKTQLGRDLNANPSTASAQEIRLLAGGVSATDTDGITKKGRYGEDLLRTTKFMICGAEKPTSWTGSKSREYVPLSVSEPLRSDYYDENVIDVWPANSDPTDYDQYWPQGTTDTAGNPLRAYPDLPFDRDTIKNYPISKLSILEGTVQKYRTAFLQRLANPLLPYNPDPNAVPSGATYDPNLEINPYIAVDAMPIDLTVFNGDATGEPLNVNNLAQQPSSYSMLARSRERGGVEEVAGGGGGGGAATYYVKKPLYPVAFLLKKDSRRPTGAEAGQLNDDRDFVNTEPSGNTNDSFPYVLDETLGGRNSVFYAAEVDASDNPIDPRQVTTQHTFWRDGPLVSGYELMMVPASEPGKLTSELGSFNNSNKFASTTSATPAGGFPHLLNFECVDSGTGDPRIGRIFEYVHVPSSYVDTQVVLPHTDPYSPTYGSLKDYPGFAPPFNAISAYREPGRININTVADESVWEAVMNGPTIQADGSYEHGSTHPGPSFADIVADRGGSTGEVRYPFRGPGTTHILEGSGTPSDPLETKPILAQEEFAPFKFEGECDLDSKVTIRGMQVDFPTSDLTDTSPSASYNNLADPYYDNSDFLRYQPVNRMGNLLTTRSNVYGVWMTIGFFETDANGNVSSGSNEAGRTTGTHERHRAFYLIDRSIPVGYEQGQDHNVDDVFRLKRYIE